MANRTSPAEAAAARAAARSAAEAARTEASRQRELDRAELRRQRDADRAAKLEEARLKTEAIKAQLAQQATADQQANEQKQQAALTLQRLQQKAAVAQKVGNFGAGWTTADSSAYDVASYLLGHSKPWEKTLKINYNYRR